MNIKKRTKRSVILAIVITAICGIKTYMPGVIEYGSEFISALEMHHGTSGSELSGLGISDSLIRLYERNEEARDFVLDYPEMGDGVRSRDISGEISGGSIPLFIQWDERWGYGHYGDDYFALTGCGPCCLSMVYCGLTGSTEYDPYTMGELAESEGFYVAGSGSSWDMMSALAEQIGLNVREPFYSAEGIRDELSSGRPVIAVMGPGEFTSSGHFIVLTGLDGDGDVIVNDPNSRLRSSRTWDIDTILSQCRQIWSYSS